MARVLWLRYRPEHDVKLLAWPILCVFPDYMQWWSQCSRRSSDFARLWVMTLSRTSRVWLAMLCDSSVHRVRRQPLVRWPRRGATRSRSTLSRYGQRTSDWGRTANPEIPSGRQTKLQFGEMELKLGENQENCTTLYLSPSWTSIEFGLLSLLVSKSEPDLTVDLKIALLTFSDDVACLLPDATSAQALTVDLSTHVVDVYSKCGPSLAARDTVAYQWRLPLKRWRTRPNLSYNFKVNEFIDFNNQWVRVAMQWISAQLLMMWFVFLPHTTQWYRWQLTDKFLVLSLVARDTKELAIGTKHVRSVSLSFSLRFSKVVSWPQVVYNCFVVLYDLNASRMSRVTASSRLVSTHRIELFFLNKTHQVEPFLKEMTQRIKPFFFYGDSNNWTSF